jgi:nucleotide-binding universal stress UspA family protein/GNAT superfamily N-acetyltransferase
MPDSRPVLLAFDDSPAAAHAIRTAGGLVGGGPAIVATAWQAVGARWAGSPIGAALRSIQPAAGELDQVAAAAAQAAAERGSELAEAAGFEPEPLAVEADGSVDAALARLAESRDARLVVVGSRGQSEMRTAVLGSVSSGLLQRLDRPVLVVGARANPARGEPVELGDGARIVIRPIEPGDKGALEDGMRRLSPGSRYRRFLSPRDTLTDAELAYLTEVDHHDHEALVALDPLTGEGVGVTRFVRLEDRPEAAEVATTVVDDWQGRGVGVELLTRLTDRARDEGIREFVGIVLEDNKAIKSMLEDLGPTKVVERGAGTVELSTKLPDEGLGALLDWLRAAARGTLRLRAPWQPK